MNILQVKKYVEQVKSTYSPLGKPLEEQIKTIAGQGRKQRDAIMKYNPKTSGYN